MDRLGSSKHQKFIPFSSGVLQSKIRVSAAVNLSGGSEGICVCASLLAPGVAPRSWHSLAGGGVAPVCLCLHTALPLSAAASELPSSQKDARSQTSL